MEDEKGFVIKDRRRFDDSGEAKPEAPREAAGDKPKEPTPEAKTAEPRTDEPKQQEQTEANFPELNFSTFVFSLGTSAMYHFGDFPDPDQEGGSQSRGSQTDHRYPRYPAGEDQGKPQRRRGEAP